MNIVSIKLIFALLKLFDMYYYIKSHIIGTMCNIKCYPIYRNKVMHETLCCVSSIMLYTWYPWVSLEISNRLLSSPPCRSHWICTGMYLRRVLSGHINGEKDTSNALHCIYSMFTNSNVVKMNSILKRKHPERRETSIARFGSSSFAHSPVVIAFYHSRSNM